MMNQAPRRLALFASIMGSLILAFNLVQEAVARLEGNRAVHPELELPAAVFMVGCSYLLAAWSAGRALPMQALRMGQFYQVILCFFFAWTQWMPSESVIGLHPSGQDLATWEADRPSWSSLIVLLGCMLQPSPPLRTLITCLMCALMEPLCYLMALPCLLQGPPRDELMVYFAATFFVCGLASSLSFALLRSTMAIAEEREIGHYVLKTKLDQGGMGEVWIAHHRLLQRRAAVKLIRAELLKEIAQGNEAIQQRFILEAKVVSGLTSPHTVALYDFGIAEDGAAYQVMELLHGLTLQELLEGHGCLPAERAVNLWMQACLSLDEAHSQGLTHRDIKPSNLFLCRLGTQYDFLKVLDFGLVALHEEAEPAELPAATEAPAGGERLTMLGSVLGTPEYISPEQIRCDRVDGRADLYGLACAVYEMITGSLPFTGSRGAILAGHLTVAPVPPRQRGFDQLPEELEELLLQCLAKDPEQRPAGAGEVYHRLKKSKFDLLWTPERAEDWWKSQGIDEQVTRKQLGESLPSSG